MSLMGVELERLKSILHHMAQNIKNVVKLTKTLMEVEDVAKRKSIRSDIENIVLILDKMRRDFVNEVMIFIARRQPLGRELISAHILISIAYDVYRISRYCREIARIDEMLEPSASLNAIANLSDIFKKAVEAVEAALDDLVRFSPEKFDFVNEIDAQVDDIYKNMLLEITSCSSFIPRDMAIKALIMRHIERIVDHAKYIEQYLTEIL
uniref:Phosphate uptake regulator PhoU n=1 Tax=Ignisphaera aggregans TaxID=334771 RepID=A0A7C2ZCT7_9CREN